MKKTHVTWNEVQSHVQSIIRQMVLEKWTPDIIVGITRGGAVPAVMISNYFNCKMVSLDVSLRDNTEYGPESNCWLPEDAETKKILIVDDINDTGATVNWIMSDWSSLVLHDKWKDNVKFAMLYDNQASNATVDIAFSAVDINKAEDDIWIVFPWENFWNSNS